MIDGQVDSGYMLEMEAWLNLADPNKTMEEAIKEQAVLGNTILEVDYENKRIKVAYSKQNMFELAWVCDKCHRMASKSHEVIIAHENECGGINNGIINT